MFANPLGLIALLAVPAVVGLHLYRRRVPTRVVSAIFLWEGQDSRSAAGRRRQPLHRSLSFWLELLAALLLGLSLAGIRGCGGGRAEHLVLVLDGSASMSSDEVLEATRDEVRARVRRLGRRDRVSVVVSGPTPRLLVGPGAPEAEALAALDLYQPGSGDHDLGPSVDLAIELAGGGAVTLLTDAFEPEPWPETVGVIALGEPSENLGITQASRPSAGQAFVEVRSFSARDREATLRIRNDSQVLVEQPVRVEAGTSSSHSLDLGSEPGSVVVELVIDDALDLDDVLTLAPPPSRRLELGVDLDEDLQHHLGLAGDRWAELVPDARPSTEPHLLLTSQDRASTERTWVLRLGSQASRSVIGPFLVERGHPLMRGVSLQGVIWTHGPGRLPGRPLVSVGEHPLLVEVEAEQGRRFELDLEPWSSTLHRSPDWPILLLNLAELRRAGLPGPRATNLVVGEDFLWNQASEGSWTLDGQALPWRSELLIPGFSEPGSHRLERDGQLVAEIAAQLADPAESDLSERSSGEREAQAPPGELSAELSLLDTLLMLLALGLICVDWFILSRQASRGVTA